jgi:plasmid stabilization system protein ParE
MASLVWTREALDRLLEIHEYISRDSSSAAKSVIDAIYAKTQLLQQ